MTALFRLGARWRRAGFSCTLLMRGGRTQDTSMQQVVVSGAMVSPQPW
jgi:hypothetical protein